MSDSANLKDGPTVMKCKITVTKNGSGYDVHYDPEIINVHTKNAALHFHIDEKSSDNVEINTVTVNPPGQTQLVDGTMSSNRQQYSIKDLNTVAGQFSLAFTYKDKNGSKLTANMFAKCGAEGIEIPEVNNNPPG